jgi:hypothetical protein
MITGCGSGDKNNDATIDPAPTVMVNVPINIKDAKTLYSWVNLPFDYNYWMTPLQPGDYSKNYNQMSYFTIDASEVPLEKTIYIKIELDSVNNSPNDLIADYIGSNISKTIDQTLFSEIHQSEFTTGITKYSTSGSYIVPCITANLTSNYYVFRLRQSGYITNNNISDHYIIKAVTAYYTKPYNG